MRRDTRPPQRPFGFTLVELMVGMALGLIVILALTFLYLSVLRSSAETLAAARLNQEVRAAMTIISADLRRSGYVEGATAEQDNPWGDDEFGYIPTDLVGNPRFAAIESLSSSPGDPREGGCIRYGYDRNGNGVADANEHFGLRLDNERLQLWLGVGSAPENCDGTEGWETLIGDTAIRVNELLFSELDANGTGLPSNYVRVVLEAQARNTRDGVVVMSLEEIVQLRNAVRPEPDSG